MAKVYECIELRLAQWMEQQPVFFVATAPLSADGLVNVSPKGLRGTFRVLDDRTVGYVDLTASGIETVAHLRENGRICLMFCAFDGPPNVVRLHGTGRVVTYEDPAFPAALAPFAGALAEHSAQPRAVVTVAVTRVADACGYAVPQMDLRGERDLLDSWTERKTPGELDDYRARRNAVSLDGLPGLW